MSEDLFIPKLGQTVEEVVLINWLVENGTRVDFGDPVLEVETDKAVFNVEANAKGYIHFGDYELGTTLPVLTVVATIGKKDEGFQPSATVLSPDGETDVKRPTVEETLSEAALSEVTEEATAISAESREKIFISPRARKMAESKGVDITKIKPTGGEGVRVVEQDILDYLQRSPRANPLAASLAEAVGLDLTEVFGTGSQGMITRSDVERTIREKLAELRLKSRASGEAKQPQVRTDKTRQPMSRVRKLIFDRMAASDRETARVTLVTEADATSLVQKRTQLVNRRSAQLGFKTGYNDLLAIVTARTLKDFPYMVARLSEDGTAFEMQNEINLGVAMDTERGLIVPVIRQADQLSLEDLGRRFRELVEGAQSGRFDPEDLQGGTFTITNLGQFDVDAFTPIINLPEVAILGIGRINPKPVAQNEEVVIRPMLTLSLVFDHRLIDGAPAARFLQKVKENIEHLPEAWIP